MTLRRDDRPIAVELFAGAGGLALGCEQAGLDVVAAVEIDPIHAATHKANFPDTEVLCCDVRGLSGEEVRDRARLGRRRIDLVVGGPPCQGFSLIGKRVLGDERNALVRHFLRLVAELRPRLFVMENVPGMAKGSHTQVLEELIEGFEAEGYRVRLPYELLNAAHYGVPQHRTRLFLLGARAGTPLPGYPAIRTSLRRLRGANGAPRQGQLFHLPVCPSAEDAIGDLPDIREIDALFECDDLGVRLRGGSQYARRLRGEVEDPDDYSYPREAQTLALTGCRRARHTKLSESRFASTEPGSTEPVSRFFKLHPDGVCNTLRAGTATDRGAFTAPRPIHFRSPRCVSVREAARLHSYPDWFRFHQTIWHGFRQIGNSVPPLLARAMAAEVVKALGVAPTKPTRVLRLTEDILTRVSMREAAAHFGVSRHVIPPRTHRRRSERARA